MISIYWQCSFEVVLNLLTRQLIYASYPSYMTRFLLQRTDIPPIYAFSLEDLCCKVRMRGRSEKLNTE